MRTTRGRGQSAGEKAEAAFKKKPDPGLYRHMGCVPEERLTGGEPTRGGYVVGATRSMRLLRALSINRKVIYQDIAFHSRFALDDAGYLE